MKNVKGFNMNNNERCAEKDLAHIWHPASQMKDYEDFPPIVIDHAKGVKLYDVDGKEYIDIISSWWCNLLGHCNDEVSQALKNQLDELDHVLFANFSHKTIIELSQRLIKVMPKGLNKFSFVDNGSASVECALKMAFQYCQQNGRQEKTRFMCFTDAYHGETLGALSVGALDEYSSVFEPIMIDTIKIEAPDCYRCKYNKSRKNCNCECFENAEKQFEKYGYETCAMIIEPLIQGSAGMKMYPPLYLKKLRALCDDYDVLLIADEIATGFGRTGKFFAVDHAGITPDIMCISKGLTNGYMAMAVACTTDEIYNGFYGDYGDNIAFMHSHTYAGNPLAASVANATLKILERDKVIENAGPKAIWLNKRFHELFDDNEHVGEIRQMGLINAIELVEDRDSKKGFDSDLRLGYRIYRKALERGLMLRPLGNVMYFNPPLVISEEELEEALEICHWAINSVLDELE